MFLMIIGGVLAVVLLGAWLWDRKWGMDLGHRDAAKQNEAEGYRDVARYNSGSYGPP